MAKRGNREEIRDWRGSNDEEARGVSNEEEAREREQ